MKHTLLRSAALALACALCASGAIAQTSGYTIVSGSNLRDATGTSVTNATIRFQPVNNSGVPISFRAGGVGGQSIAYPVSTTVSSGAFSIQLADTTLTSPVNVCYSVTLLSNLTGREIPFPGYSCIQPSGSTWNFDTYTPNLGSMVVQQSGIPGTSANLVPDPNFANGFAQWSNVGGWTIANGTPYASLNSVVASQSASQTLGAVGSTAFYLTVGQTYVLSGYIDATGVTPPDSPTWAIYDLTNTTAYAQIFGVDGHAEERTSTFTFTAAGHSAGDLVAVHLIFSVADSPFTSLSASNPSVALVPTPCSVSIGSVTELSSGSMPTVTNSGTACAAVLNFGIPAGGSGSSGSTFAFSINGSVIASAADGLSINGTSLGTSATTILINGATL